MLSYLRYLTLVTFRKQNPDWQMKFFYPKSVYTGGPVWNQGFAEQVTGVNYFEKVKEISNVQCLEIDWDKEGVGHIPDVFRSDILRLKLLGSDGGVWSDMDIIYFKPMDSIVFNSQQNSHIDTVISYNSLKSHYSIGFLMSCQNNPFFHFLYSQAMLSKQQGGEYQHLGITLWHKHFPIVQSIRNKFPQLSIMDIDMWLCYFLDAFNWSKIINEDIKLTDLRTIALHFYGGHPNITKFESKVTEQNIYTWNNTLTNTIRRALA